MHDNVLFPIDLQHEASWSRALPVARQLAGTDGTLHLLGIVPDIGSSMVATFLPRGFEAKALSGMKEALDSFVDAHLAGARVAVHVGHGHVAETILKWAQDVQADVIVMASHKPDELRSILISSHANSVVRHSPVSVMVVR
ncbi:universal stress protein [Paracoccus spongiarum]|uniref:Universal stress protein n=1 Tax=Paracoccus spongiarum TaxID=3064387 RepID=A0ABT9JDI4_9RHOB|nr:universal stress protein [Paracoccus sp. 2205BS29-5]MDP5307867.1 universal stress protein [Paracoccus sp. 2205BS29-5]